MKKILILGTLSLFGLGSSVNAMGSNTEQDEQPMAFGTAEFPRTSPTLSPAEQDEQALVAGMERLQLSPLPLTSEEIKGQRATIQAAIRLAIHGDYDDIYSDDNELGVPKVVHDICMRISNCQKECKRWMPDQVKYRFSKYCQEFMDTKQMDLVDVWDHVDESTWDDLFALFLLYDTRNPRSCFAKQKTMFCGWEATQELASFIERNLGVFKSADDMPLRLDVGSRTSLLEAFSKTPEKVQYMKVGDIEDPLKEKDIALIGNILRGYEPFRCRSIQFPLGGFSSPKVLADFLSLLKQNPYLSRIRVQVLGILGQFDSYKEIFNIEEGQRKGDLTEEKWMKNLRDIGLLKGFDASRMILEPTQLLSLKEENVEITCRYYDNKTYKVIKEESTQFNLKNLPGDIRVLWCSNWRY